MSLVPCLSVGAGRATNCGASSGLAGRRIYGERFTRSYTAATNWGTTGVASGGELGLRRGRYKLVGAIEGTGASRCMSYEFYDLTFDPYETDDLRVGGSVMSGAQDSAYRDLRSYLRTTLAPDWIPARVCAI